MLNFDAGEKLSVLHFIDTKSRRADLHFAFHVYSHRIEQMVLTSLHLTKKGIISPKLQLLSGHAEEKSLAIYRDLALPDVAGEYEEA